MSTPIAYVVIHADVEHYNLVMITDDLREARESCDAGEHDYMEEAWVLSINGYPWHFPAYRLTSDHPATVYYRKWEYPDD